MGISTSPSFPVIALAPQQEKLLRTAMSKALKDQLRKVPRWIRIPQVKLPSGPRGRIRIIMIKQPNPHYFELLAEAGRWQFDWIQRY